MSRRKTKMDKEKLFKAAQMNDAISNLRTKIHIIEKFKTGDAKINIHQDGFYTSVMIPDELKNSIIALIDGHYNSRLEKLEQEFEEM